MNKYQSGRSQLALSAPSRSAGSATERYELAGASHLAWLVEVASLCGDVIFFFFQAEDGIRDHCVTGVRRVLFRSRIKHTYCQCVVIGRASSSFYAEQPGRSEEHTSELQSHSDLVCRLLLEKKK